MHSPCISLVTNLPTAVTFGRPPRWSLVVSNFDACDSLFKYIGHMVVSFHWLVRTTTRMYTMFFPPGSLVLGNPLLDIINNRSS